jgi:hypothetical protein
MKLCKRCLTNKPDIDFPLGERTCRECKNKQMRERRLRIKQIKDDTAKEIDKVFSGIREDY